MSRRKGEERMGRRVLSEAAIKIRLFLIRQLQAAHFHNSPLKGPMYESLQECGSESALFCV